jgi:VWFA-related protein
MKRITFLSLLGGYGWQAAAQSQPEEDEEVVFRSRVTNVVVPTTVFAKGGGFVDGLTERDFQLLDNNTPQRFKVDTVYQPISLVVAVQCSASTEGVLETVKKMGPLLEQVIVGEQGSVAILAFDSRLRLMQDFTNDGKLLTAALNKLQPGSMTSRLLDAADEGVRLLKRRPKDHRRVLLMVGETQDQGSATRIRTVVRGVQFNEIQVYTLNMSRWLNKITQRPGVPRPDHIPASARPMPAGQVNTPTSQMQQGFGGGYGNFAPLVKEVWTATKAVFVSNPQELLTRYTGGREVGFVSQKAMEQALQSIGEELHSQYLLNYTPSNANEGGWHSIQVIVNREVDEVRCKSGYWTAASGG